MLLCLFKLGTMLSYTREKPGNSNQHIQNKLLTDNPLNDEPNDRLNFNINTLKYITLKLMKPLQLPSG